MSSATEDPYPEELPEYYHINLRTGSIGASSSGAGYGQISISEILYRRLLGILENERSEQMDRDPDYAYAIMCQPKSNHTGRDTGYADEDAAVKYRCRRTGDIVTVRRNSWNYEDIAHSPNYRPYPCEYDTYLKHGVDVEKILGLK